MADAPSMLLAWLREASQLAAGAAHPTTITLDGDNFVIHAHLSSQHPLARAIPLPEVDALLPLAELDGARISPFPRLIRAVNEYVSQAVRDAGDPTS